MFGTRAHRHCMTPKLENQKDYKSLSKIFFQKLKHHRLGIGQKKIQPLHIFKQKRVCAQDKKKILSQNRLGRKHGTDDGSLLNSLPLTALGNHSDSVSASNQQLQRERPTHNIISYFIICSAKKKFYSKDGDEAPQLFLKTSTQFKMFYSRGLRKYRVAQTHIAVFQLSRTLLNFRRAVIPSFNVTFNLTATAASTLYFEDTNQLVKPAN